MKNLFRVIAKKILKRNKKFHNLYSGQTCYLFGNGSSIKHYDLKLFGDKPSLCCGNLFLHNDFKYLNVVADIELHPFLNYPFWKNPYYSFEYNRYNAFLRKSGKYKQKHPVFVSISNYPVLYLDNIYYLYHFGHRNIDFNRMDLSGDFSFMKGALYGLIGLALFMGFENVLMIEILL